MGLANKMRFTAHAPDTQKQSIKITDAWQKELSSMPYLSQKSGKTIHLLKQSSKPAMAGKKRKKVALLGTLEQFKDSKKKPSPPPQQPVLQSSLAQSAGASQGLQPPTFNLSNARNDGPGKTVPPMFASQKGKDAKMKDN